MEHPRQQWLKAKLKRYPALLEPLENQDWTLFFRNLKHFIKDKDFTNNTGIDKQMAETLEHLVAHPHEHLESPARRHTLRNLAGLGLSAVFPSLAFGQNIEQEIAEMEKRITHLSSPELVRLSTLYGNMNRLEEFGETAQKAIKKDPSNSHAYVNLGNYFSFKKNKEEAIKTFEKGIEIDKKNPDLYANLAIVYTDVKNFDQGLKFANMALSLDNTNPAAYNARGVSYLFKGKYKEAREDFLKSIDFAKNNPLSYSQVGEKAKYWINGMDARNLR